MELRQRQLQQDVLIKEVKLPGFKIYNILLLRI